MVATTFWEVFFLFLIFMPLAMMWAFALIDIFRRNDMGGFSKALWVTCVILVPFFGTLIYLVTRPKDELVMQDEARYGTSTSQLAALADLHDRGKLTDDEFASEKARLLSLPPAAYA